MCMGMECWFLDLCVSDGDGSTPCGTLTDLVSFLVLDGDQGFLIANRQYVYIIISYSEQTIHVYNQSTA